MTSATRIPRNPAELPASSAQTKADLRRTLLAERRAVPAETRAEWDRQLCANIVKWWEDSGVDALGVYWPLRDEPDLHAAYAELSHRGVRLLLPVVIQRDTALEFASWEIGETMVKDGMGVAVPAHLRIEPYPPALLVPCLGFNSGGFRLGYGGGFYDRTLARDPRPATVGVAWSCLEVEFGVDNHDIALDVVITE
ncbi:5-formyltetrahydrofolate cyclo-ligase [Pseudoduganella sp. UC29_106]|uniref:5-formyltetrahydrofolate cyclo-ligase n=1 Tax=Pseudoduganella sp. UC29_106 TaxID=3374553 RepID=UPI0037578A32